MSLDKINAIIGARILGFIVQLRASRAHPVGELSPKLLLPPLLTMSTYPIISVSSLRA